MLVHYVTSNFIENRNLFVVVSVTFEYIAGVCNLVGPIWLLLPRRVSLFSIVMHVPNCMLSQQ